MVDAKQKLRQELRRLRDALSEKVRARAAREAADRALALPGLTAAHVVATYAAMGSELDPAPLVAELESRGITVVFPLVQSSGSTATLTFHRTTRANLVPGPFNLHQPDPARAPVVPLEAIEAFLVPGLGFDRKGNRLGWGKGYYDGALAGQPGLRVGYAFHLQLCDSLPQTPNDVPMDFLVTNHELVRYPPRI